MRIMLYSIFSKHTLRNVLKNNILHISFWSYFTFQNISKTIRFNFEKKKKNGIRVNAIL